MSQENKNRITLIDENQLQTLKEEYKKKLQELSLRHKDKGRTELEKEFILGRFNQLLTVVKDLERVL